MFIDLDFNNDYIIDKGITIPKDYYINSDIHDINNLHIKGKLYYDNENILHGLFDIKGNMILSDAISLEDVNYPFFIKYDDILEESYKNEQNKLDLFEFLWENIVLEVPLKFTTVKNLDEFKGNGWKLISEEENKSNNNPFSDLLKKFDKEE